MTSKLTKKGAAEVRALLDKKKGEFAKVLNQSITPEYFTRVALTAIQQSNDLLECSPPSLYMSLLKAAQLSLNCDGLLGQAYLVPYAGKAQLIIGYKGLRELALRTGKYKDIRARVVYSKDLFEVCLGYEESIKHIPFEGERGEMRAVYAIAITQEGSAIGEFMWAAEVIKHRNQYSKSWKKSDSMWQTAPERAWEKTVIRRLCNRLQMSVTVQELLAREDRMEMGLELPETEDDIIDVIPDNEPEQPETAETGQEGGKQSGVDGLVNAVKKGRKTQDKAVESDLAMEDLKEAIHGKMDEMRGNAVTRTEIDKFCTAGLGEPNIALTDVLNLSSLDKTKLEKLWNFIKDK